MNINLFDDAIYNFFINLHSFQRVAAGQVIKIYFECRSFLYMYCSVRTVLYVLWYYGLYCTVCALKVELHASTTAWSSTSKIKIYIYSVIWLTLSRNINDYMICSWNLLSSFSYCSILVGGQESKSRILNLKLFCILHEDKWWIIESAKWVVAYIKRTIIKLPVLVPRHNCVWERTDTYFRHSIRHEIRNPITCTYLFLSTGPDQTIQSNLLLLPLRHHHLSFSSSCRQGPGSPYPPIHPCHRYPLLSSPLSLQLPHTPSLRYHFYCLPCKTW